MAFIAKLGGQTSVVRITETEKSIYKVVVDGHEFTVDGRRTGRNNYSLLIDNRSFEVDVDVDVDVDATEDEYRVLLDGRTYHISMSDERQVRVGSNQSGIEVSGRQEVKIPMPGKVVTVLVNEGDTVTKGQGLVIVEAMKMENEVRAPSPGTIKEIRVKTGEAVESGQVLVIVE
ncbi:MAG: biotin/lipoyl-binding protein [Deltaproteobacteria bacterium]|nr:biotin/lipoyl-binding protein [Deltaproteobacteria bacterium]